jgi:rsbT antagonist protein RsbS
VTTTSPLLVSILRQGDHLLASINGALDDGELLRFQAALIERIGQDRCRGVIIDVAALDVLDSYGAHTLGRIAEMARLRGAETVVVGVSPEIAFTMVRLGMSIPNVHTALDLERGLELLGRLTQRGHTGGAWSGRSPG